LKHFNWLASREFLVLVAIVASAITMHVRMQADAASSQAAQQVQYGRMCEPTSSSKDEDDSKARAVPADCELRTNVRTSLAARPWV
jgi:hypothetical protein